MLAKLTSKNQLTLPKTVVQAVGPAEYFDVDVREGQIVLTPVRIQRADAVRAKLAILGVTESDVADAVRWVRTGGSSLAVNEPEPGPVRATAKSPSSARKKSVRRA